MAQDETRVSEWKQPVIPSPRQRQEDCKIGVNMDSEFKASPGFIAIPSQTVSAFLSMGGQLVSGS